MSGYYLCTAKRAEHPYYIESIGIHIYSIEELCYYFRENVYLIDETILEAGLCEWIGRELGLGTLAKMLFRELERESPASAFVLPIMEESGYLTAEELEYFKEQLAEIALEPPQVRRKMKADYLVYYGKYPRAVREYAGILEEKNLSRMGIQFYAVVLENMATAYAHMFRFEEAANCLWESYQTLKSKKVYEKYLRLLPLFLSEQGYRDRLAQIRADRDEAYRLKKDTEEMFLQAQESAAAEAWKNGSMAEQVERLKETYLEINS